MKNICQFHYLLLLLALGFSCSTPEKKEEAPVKIEMITDQGTVILQLSNKTPKHRDNMIRLVNEGYYDGLAFHRVIEGFGIQNGDLNTKVNLDTLEDYDLKQIPAEINKDLFHKRGALNAARNNNPERASAAAQFFLVQGTLQTDSTLDIAEDRINGWLAEYYVMHDKKYQDLTDSLKKAMEERDWETAGPIRDSLENLAKTYTPFEKYIIPEAHREVYKTIGGSPHLDQNYTVFGEILSGMDVVDGIAAAERDSTDRPLEDVRIQSMRIQ